MEMKCESGILLLSVNLAILSNQFRRYGMIKEKMSEPEVSLLIALYFIKNGLTKEDVYVSIDGAHVKTEDRIHFNINDFMSDQQVPKTDGDSNRWQGTYEIDPNYPKLIIHSKPGYGDVTIKTLDGKTIYIESKKGDLLRKRGQEYPLMREAIGQLMTGLSFNSSIIPTVAVPFTEKSFDLATKWSKLPQIRELGIRFMLVNLEGNVIEI